MANIEFKNPVANPDEPQGRIASRVRELVGDSNVRSGNDLRRRTGYAGATLTESWNGKKRQNPRLIRRIVEACVPDREESEAEIERLVAILDEKPARAVPLVDERPAGQDEHDDGQDNESHGDDGPEDVVIIDDREPPKLQSPDRPRWRWVAVGVVALLVLAGAGLVAYLLLAPGACGPDADQAGGQCIGLSDGSVNLAADPAFTTVLGKIKTENDRILGPGHAPVVSVAYAVPFPAAHAPLSDQTLRGLEGAYEMQLQRNEAGGSNPLGGPPRVQLLVANLGPEAAQPEQVTSVVNRLRERTTPSDPTSVPPLVAVIGLDQSRPGITDTITKLGQAGIPMVAGRLAADDFAQNAADRGFFAAAPPVHDQVAAAVRYLGARARNPLLVQDTNKGDLYGRNIAGQFQNQFAALGTGTALPEPVGFDASLPGVQTAFATSVLPTICQRQPDVVFYAGRGANLPDFIRALGTRTCPQIPVTVLSLSDGRDLANAIRAENTDPTVEHQLTAALTGPPGGAGITMIVAAETHPGIWADRQLVPDGSHAVLSGSFATAFPQQFPDQGQVDEGGDVMMGHDAMQIVVEAIVRSRPVQSRDPITTGLLRQALGGITANAAVYGASGPTAYTGTPGVAAAGFPVNKNIPITQIQPTGQITLLRARTP